MTKFTTLILSILILIFLLFEQELKATHAMGGDITYKCLGNNQYEITLNFYRDCAGIAAPSSVTVDVSSSSNCGSSFNATLQPVPGKIQLDVTPLCPDLRECNECNPAAQLKPVGTCDTIYPGVELTRFRGIITLPSNCTDWVVSYVVGNRNNQITNLTSPGGTSMYIAAGINNMPTVIPCNNSSDFTELPVPYICRNQLYNYNHGAVDIDGDSLVYEFIQPMGGSSTFLQYSAGYSVVNPLSTVGAFNFNTNNGQLTFTPDGQQVAVMTVRVNEYRNGVLVGWTMRDIQVVVIDCATNQISPGPQNLPSSSMGIKDINSVGYLLDSTTIGVCPGNQLRWTIVGVDGNQFDSVYISTNITSVLPGATYTVTGNNPTSINFRWTPTAADSGQHFYTITLRDNHCPTYSSQTFSYSILVNKEVKASDDTITCTAAGPLILTARGGNSFQWRPNKYIIDASGPDSSWIKIQPTLTTQYIVKSTDCDNEDTVLVTVAPSFTYTKSPDTLICKYQSVPLQVKPDPAFAPYIYTWRPPDSLSSTTVGSVIANPTSDILYHITMKSKDGCTLWDSIAVKIKGEAPIVNVFSNKIAMCPDPTDQIQLQLITTPGSCGINTTPCASTLNEYIVGKGAKVSTTNHPFRGNSEKARTQMLFTPTELNNLGFIGGTISKIAFNVSAKNSTSPYRNMTIKIGCVNTGFQNKFKEELVEVYSPKDYSTKLGWNEIILDNGYDWNGSTNLVIEICYTNSSRSFDDELVTTSTSYQSLINKVDNTPNTFGCDLFTALSARTERPNIKFSICNDQPSHYVIDWTPGHNLSDSTIGNPVINSPDFTQTTTYNVSVDNDGCANDKDITIIKDISTLTISKDTILCAPGQVQLFSSITPANPPVKNLTCGVNGTQITNPGIEYQPASGNTNHQGTIFRGTMEDVRYQILYLADELKAAGLKEGIISEYSFEIATKVSTIPVENFTIRMGCTNDVNLTTTAWQPTSATAVYTTPSYNSQLGWNKFVLDNPFDWDGESNIVIEICWDNANGNPLDGDDQIMTEVVGYKAISRAYSTGVSGCTISTPTSVDERLPNARFTISEPPLGDFEPKWTPGLTLNDSLIFDPIADPSVTTTYIMSVISEYGCLYTDTVTIFIGDLDASIDPDTVICLGDSVAISAYDGYSYLWTPSSTLHPDTGNTVISFPYQTTTYTVTVSDSIGCKQDRMITVRVNNLPVASAGHDDSLYLGQSITLHGSGGINYMWDPPMYLDDHNVKDPVSTPAERVTYILTVIDENGCKNTDTVTLYIFSQDDLLIPSAFSPNGDGVNDNFIISKIGVTEVMSMEIYNRWGKRIFHSGVGVDIWDGMSEGVEQPIGTYVYKIIGKKYDGTQAIYKGNITLLR